MSTSMLKIDNDADEFAMLQAVELDPPSSFPELLCRLALLTASDEDFEIVIRRKLLPYSYQVNGSMLGNAAFIKYNVTAPTVDRREFESYVTYKVGRYHLAIRFSRSEVSRSSLLPANKKSFVGLIKDWLLTDKETPLSVPRSTIAEAYKVRPEQAVYRVWQDTGRRVLLRRTPSHFIITLPEEK